MTPELDIEGSRVRLGDRWFPAVIIVWDIDGERPDTCLYQTVDRSQDDWIVQIPLENGALVSVVWDCRSRGGKWQLDLHLIAPVWAEQPEHPADTIMLFSHQGAIRAGTPRRRWRAGQSIWQDCDLEWAAEHIERLSTMPCELPTGRRMKFVRLNEAEDVCI